MSLHLVALALLALAGYARADNVTTLTTPVDVICEQPDTQFFCTMVKNSAGSNGPTALLISNKDAVLTIFVPTDRGINESQALLKKFMGITLHQLLTRPSFAERFIKNHVVIGVASDSRTWRSGVTKWRDALGVWLSVLEGEQMNLFITYNSSPIQHSKVLRFNLEGGKSLMDVMEKPLYALV